MELGNQLVYLFMMMSAKFHVVSLVRFDILQTVTEYLELSVNVNQKTAEQTVASNGRKAADRCTHYLMNVSKAKPNRGRVVVR